MSRVISFRLDDADDAPDDERKALEVLDYWQRRGIDARQVIAKALAQFDRGEPPATPPVTVDTGEIIAAIRAELPTMPSNNGNDLAESQALAHELRQTLRQAQGLVESLRRTPTAAPTVASTDQADLKPEFVNAIRKSARRGFSANG